MTRLSLGTRALRAGSVGSDGESASTPTSRTGLELWQAARGPALAAIALMLVAVAVSLIAARHPAGELDPNATDPSGSRALAQLLRDRGTAVDRVASVAAAAATESADPNITIFLPLPDRLPAASYAPLTKAGRDLVVVNPSDEVLGVLASGVRRSGSTDSGPRQPVCRLPEAASAGVADTGGTTYLPGPAAAGAVGCYASGGAASLLVVPRPSGGTTAILGSGAAFTNDRLDRAGNAALALGLLTRTSRVIWLVPPPGAAVAAGPHDKTLVELLPSWVWPAALQLGVAVAFVAGWRARRLGPVVTEPLPVVVRAVEAVEGRARLYQGSAARDRAAEALRAGVRSRLIDLLGLPSDAAPAAVVDAVGIRVERDRGAVEILLYGAAPTDDPALVRLAGDLDALDQEVRRQ